MTEKCVFIYFASEIVFCLLLKNSVVFCNTTLFLSFEFLVKYFYISIPVLAREEMPSFAVMIANVSLVKHLSR